MGWSSNHVRVCVSECLIKGHLFWIVHRGGGEQFDVVVTFVWAMGDRVRAGKVELFKGVVGEKHHRNGWCGKWDHFSG